MAQVICYAKANGQNFNGDWASTAAASDTLVTGPANGGTTYICDLNGKTGIVLNVNPNVDQIRTGVTNAGGSMAVPNSGTVTINVAVTDGVKSTYNGTMITWGTGTCALTITAATGNAVTYTSTSTSGMLTVGTGQTLTITGSVSITGSGTTIVESGTGALSVTGISTAPALLLNGSGKAVSCTGTGLLTLSGTPAIATGGSAGVGPALSISAAINSSSTITGDCQMSSGNANNSTLINMSAGTITLAGNIRMDQYQSGQAIGLNLSGGTFNLQGIFWDNFAGGYGASRSHIYMTGGTLNWGKAATTYTMAAGYSGKFYGYAGTLNITNLILNNSGLLVIDAAIGITQSGSSYTLKNMTATAQICDVAGTPYTITGPSIPSAANTLNGVARGFPSDGGAAVSGGGTANGTYVAPAASDVRQGVNVGVTTGSLKGVVDSGGTLHTYGTCNSAQAWAAAGIIYSSGTAAIARPARGCGRTCESVGRTAGTGRITSWSAWLGATCHGRPR